VRGRESVDNKERAKGDEERGAVTHGEGQMEHGSGFGRGAFSRG
jgi:hypothetical protein